MAAFGLDPLRALRWRRWRFTRRHRGPDRVGFEPAIGARLIATRLTRLGRVLQRWPCLETLAKEQTAKPFQRDLALLQGKHQPQTRADNLLQALCDRHWQITLMHVCHEALALFATQRHVVRWLFHP
jgi:hypothetical protein